MSAPQVSILILCRDRWPDTRRCLESLRQSTRPGSCEILVRDNGSTDRTARELAALSRKRPELRVLAGRRDSGFAEGVNLCGRKARGRYLLWLNNDTVLAPGWLEGLVAAAESDPAIAAVGPMTNRMAPPQQLGRPFKTRPGLGVEEAPFLGGFCLLVRREAARLAGELDERFLWGWEDVDYCLRLRQAGLRLVVASNVFVRHEGSRTLESMAGPRRAATDAANRALIRAKWGASPFAGDLRDLFKWFRAPWDQPLPRVSVAVLCSDRVRAAACLAAVRRTRDEPAREVLAVDATSDGSLTPCLRRLAADWPGLRVMGPWRARSRGAAINAALRRAQGDWLALLDDDVIVRDGWLRTSLEAFSLEPGLGMMTSPGTSSRAPARGPGKAVLYAPDRVFLMPRRVFESVGGLDERFDGSLLDADYRLRVLQAGLRVLKADALFFRQARQGRPARPAGVKLRPGFQPRDRALMVRRWIDPFWMREVLDDLSWRAAEPLRPEASVAVICRHGFERARPCLESVRRAGAGFAYEVLAWELPSRKPRGRGLESLAREWPELRLPGPWQTSSYAHAVNLALRSALGRHLAVLRDDAVAEPGWLDALVAAAKTQGNIGVAGPRTDGSLVPWQHACGPARRASRGRATRVGYLRDLCLLMPAAVHARLGGFDDRFEGSLGAEDYCLRARQAGYQVVVAEDAFVGAAKAAGRGVPPRGGRDAALMVSKWAGHPLFEATLGNGRRTDGGRS